MVKAPQHGRPRSVTLTAWGVFLLGLANGWRAVSLGRQSTLQLELDVAVDPRLRLFVAALWAILLLAAAIVLWRRRPVARAAIPILLFTYTVYQLGLILFFSQSVDSRRGWPLTALLYSGAILFVIWTLHGPAGKRYFRSETGD